MENEGPKLDNPLLDQIASHLKLPTISMTSPDLDFLLSKKVDREMDLVGVFKQANESADPSLFQGLGALVQGLLDPKLIRTRFGVA
ncbi:MAG: hypothetical protein OEW45_13070 [Deltaproteobacteria bacterium]|nr:hypothetical protein [Deltaproteobacteria bacterium]